MRSLLPGVAFLLASMAAVASAQTSPPLSSDFDEDASGETQARDAFAAGRTALDEGRSEDALADFREAYRLSGRPELLYNIGMVEERLHHDRPALEAFEGYLEAIPAATNRASVEERIRNLREEIARDDAVSAALSQTSQPGHDGGDDLIASPVLWVIVGVVVVGAAVGIGLGVGLSQDPGTAPATPGPSGVVISALSF
jgi:tetratricopeptide (TPR) repeat protein